MTSQTAESTRMTRGDVNMITIIGPGHGGPSAVAHAWLEGTYSELYPTVSQDEEHRRPHRISVHQRFPIASWNDGRTGEVTIPPACV